MLRQRGFGTAIVVTSALHMPEGTGVGNYIHVVDLAEGHLRALTALQTRTGAHVWNLGTGQGYSVLEMVRAFEAASGQHCHTA